MSAARRTIRETGLSAAELEVVIGEGSP
jgi:hypothetical protein